jgi:hypothetical protein
MSLISPIYLGQKKTPSGAFLPKIRAGVLGVQIANSINLQTLQIEGAKVPQLPLARQKKIILVKATQQGGFSLLKSTLL